MSTRRHTLEYAGWGILIALGLVAIISLYVGGSVFAAQSLIDSGWKATDAAILVTVMLFAPFLLGAIACIVIGRRLQSKKSSGESK